MFNSTTRVILKKISHYISQIDTEQIYERLNTLPQPLVRMILVFEECDLCYSELCSLKLDCIRKNINSQWQLTYHKQKTTKEITILVSPEIVKVIQEQQSYIKEVFDIEFSFLFCSRKQGSTRKGKFIPEPRPMSSKIFAKYYKRSGISSFRKDIRYLADS